MSSYLHIDGYYNIMNCQPSLVSPGGEANITINDVLHAGEMGEGVITLVAFGSSVLYGFHRY